MISTHPHSISTINSYGEYIVRGQSVNRRIDFSLLRLQIQVHKSTTIRSQPQAFTHWKDEVNIAIAPYSVTFRIIEVFPQLVALHVDRVESVGSSKDQGSIIHSRDVVNEVYRITAHLFLRRQSDQCALVPTYP